MFKRLLMKSIIVENTYICPNCGNHFIPKWDDVRIPIIFSPILDYIRPTLKCPKCNVRDICRIKKYK